METGTKQLRPPQNAHLSPTPWRPPIHPRNPFALSPPHLIRLNPAKSGLKNKNRASVVPIRTLSDLFGPGHTGGGSDEMGELGRGEEVLQGSGAKLRAQRRNPFQPIPTCAGYPSHLETQNSKLKTRNQPTRILLEAIRPVQHIDARQGPRNVDLRTPPGQECSNGSLLCICRGHPGIFHLWLTIDDLTI